MKPNITQSYIAKRLGVSAVFINRLINGSQRPNWKRAKQLSKLTGSTPELWLEGTPEQIKNFLQNSLHSENTTSIMQKHSTVKTEQFKEQNNICQQEAQ